MSYARYSGLGGGSGGGGGGVTSLNGATGAVTLVAGSNITITPVGSNITIAASSSGIGSVTSVSVVSANGLAGTVANPTTTPAITLSTTITGLLKGNGTAISAQTVGNLTDVGTDGIAVTNGTGAVLGTGTSIAQQQSSASLNGFLSSADWSTFNSKQSALTFGNLTDAGTDGITITGGTGAVIGTGTSIAQNVADTTHNGYLASTDWNTFNSKQPAGSYITALTGGVTASGPGSAIATVITNANLTGGVTSVGNAATVVTNANLTGDVTSIGNATNLVATSNSTITTLSALSLPGTQVTGNISGNAANVTGTVAIANGGTGQVTAAAAFNALTPMTTTGDIEYESATNVASRLPIGTNGQFLVVSSGLPSWQTISATGQEFYISSVVNTASSIITSASFVTFSNSPALTFAPVLGGTYKVYCSFPTFNPSSFAVNTRIFNTTGGATLLAESQSTNDLVLPSGFTQSIYTLNASTTYVFDIQGSIGGGANLTNRGDQGQFFMFAERMGN